MTPMFPAVCIAAGMIIGAVIYYIVSREVEMDHEGRIALYESNRWERAEGDLDYGVISSLRRMYPAYEFVTNVLLVDVLKPVGARSDDIFRDAKNQRLSVVMVHKMTARREAVIFTDREDPDLEAKRRIISRSGMKVIMMMDEPDENEIEKRMAA